MNLSKLFFAALVVFVGLGQNANAGLAGTAESSASAVVGAVRTLTTGGTLSVREVAALGGEQNVSTLKNALALLKSRGNLDVESVAWKQAEALVAARAAKEGLTVSQTISLYAQVAQAAPAQSGQTLVSFFQKTQPKNNVVIPPAPRVSPEETIADAMAKVSPENRIYLQALLGSGSTTTGPELAATAEILSVAKNSPMLCSLESKSFCESQSLNQAAAWASRFAKAGPLAVRTAKKVFNAYDGEYNGRMQLLLEGMLAGGLDSANMRACWLGTAE